MNPALLVTSTVSTLALILLALLALRSPGPERWDYTIAAPSDLTFDLEMSSLGRQGWEVVTCRRAVNSSEIDKSAAYECIFKRPL